MDEGLWVIALVYVIISEWGQWLLWIGVGLAGAFVLERITEWAMTVRTSLEMIEAHLAEQTRQRERSDWSDPL